MAYTETYIDPAIAANSGSGTSGDPYGDLQYALDTMTRDATNGDRLNIKAGTAEVMSAGIDLTTYGTPTAAAPLIFQGYTSAAGDGGVGEINNGGANVSVMSSATLDYITFADMKLGNTGTAQIVKLDRYNTFINCEFHTSSAANAVQMTSNGCSFNRCKFHSITGAVILAISTNTDVSDCYFSYGVSSSYCISAANTSAIRRCIFDLTGAARGLTTSGDQVTIEFCSFYASSGTGFGVNMAASDMILVNNIFAGFSGVGGRGILYSSAWAAVMGNNAFYNNTTDISGTPLIRYSLANISLSNAPFTNAGSGDFSIATAAQAELKAAGWPSSFNGISTNQYLDVGAAQIQIPTGGGRRPRGRYHGI